MPFAGYSSSSTGAAFCFICFLNVISTENAAISRNASEIGLVTNTDQLPALA